MKETRGISISRLRELINEALEQRGVYDNQVQAYHINDKEYFVKKNLTRKDDKLVETYKIYNEDGALLKEVKGKYLDIKRYIKEQLA
jgi:hypothetical protein